MYLSQLDTEKQCLFLDLCIHAALANGVVTDEEKCAIDLYCIEMNLSQSDYIPKNALDDVLDALKKTCTPMEIRIIIIEISALIMSDGAYDSLENDFMKKIQEKFEISDEVVEETFTAINQLLKAYSMLNKVIQC